MIPAPKLKDVFMDLYADSVPFLHGEGHQGMVIGGQNILRLTMNKIIATLHANPGYNFMVIGYSLGAGICQMVALDLTEGAYKDMIPAETDVRCISFGAPPVFRSDNVDHKSPNIFSVVYNNDGLASASVASVMKLLMQIRAVNQLQLRRRDMIKLLWNKVPTLDGGELKEEPDDDDDDDFVNKTGSTKTTTVLTDPTSLWKAIQEASDSAEEVCSLKPLGHPARQLFLFKRRETNIITRLLTDTQPLSDHMRLRGAMFSHHMPWGYNALFEGYGSDIDRVDFSILKCKASLYPDLPTE